MVSKGYIHILCRFEKGGTFADIVHAGGSFTYGSKDEPTTQPGGLILQSVANGYPVINVEMNYRLGGESDRCFRLDIC